MGQYESITMADIRLVQYVWAYVMEDLEEYAAHIFFVTYTNYPVLENYFQFSGPTDAKFERHTMRYIQEINKLVRNLERPAVLQRMLLENGVMHSTRNIEPQHYDRLREGFVKAINERMGVRKFNVEEEQCFNKLFKIMSDNIVEASENERTRRGISIY